MLRKSEEHLLLKTKTFSKDGSLNNVSYKQFTIIKGNQFMSKLFLIAFIIGICNVHWYFPGEIYARKRIYISLLLLFIIGVITLNLLFTVVEEQLLLVVPIRLQTSTTFLFGQRTTLSIPWHTIGDFMIIDEIIGQQVLPFLAVESKQCNQPHHIILFPNIRPRLVQLERIYRDLQRIIDASR